MCTMRSRHSSKGEDGRPKKSLVGLREDGRSKKKKGLTTSTKHRCSTRDVAAATSSMIWSVAECFIFEYITYGNLVNAASIQIIAKLSVVAGPLNTQNVGRSPYVNY